jgi:hypothetical protein
LILEWNWNGGSRWGGREKGSPPFLSMEKLFWRFVRGVEELCWEEPRRNSRRMREPSREGLYLCIAIASRASDCDSERETKVANKIASAK